MVVAVVAQSLCVDINVANKTKTLQPAENTEPANKQIARGKKNNYRKHSKRQKEAPRTQWTDKKVFLFLSSDMKCREQKSRVYIRNACLNERREYWQL